MLEHLSKQAQDRMRASEHPDLYSDVSEKEMVEAANEAADQLFEESIPILDAALENQSEQRSKSSHRVTR